MFKDLNLKEYEYIEGVNASNYYFCSGSMSPYKRTTADDYRSQIEALKPQASILMQYIEELESIIEALREKGMRSEFISGQYKALHRAEDELAIVLDHIEDSEMMLKMEEKYGE
jgi:predicted RNase H-like nuclease (RuvC/YqgF family)